MGVSTARPISDPNYYLREQSLVPVRWDGNASKTLGIYGQPVDPQVFLNLHDGYTTRDGQRDVKLPRYMHPERRGSFDVTVNLPKCVSLMHAMGDSRIVEVLTDSMDAVKREIEKQAWTRCPWERNNNLAMAGFVHGGSRADDPHLHGHIVFQNLALSSKGWKAIELGRNVDWEGIGKKAADVQVKGLRECGYRVKRSGQEFEIVGVPAEVKARFSKRGEAIQERAEEYERLKGAPLSPKAKGKLSVQGRPEKSEISHEERQAGFMAQVSDEERAELNKVYLRSRHRVNGERWSTNARMAFERQRGVVRESHEPERSAGRDR